MEEQSGLGVTWASLFLLTGEGRATHQPPRGQKPFRWFGKVPHGCPMDRLTFQVEDGIETDQDLFLGADSDPSFSPGSPWFSQKLFFHEKGLKTALIWTASPTASNSEAALFLDSLIKNESVFLFLLIGHPFSFVANFMRDSSLHVSEQREHSLFLGTLNSSDDGCFAWDHLWKGTYYASCPGDRNPWF